MIDNLKTKLLLKINVLNSKKIIVDLNKQKFRIQNYDNFNVNLKINVKNNVKIRRIIKIKKK